jgi:DNA adenine methylase
MTAVEEAVTGVRRKSLAKQPVARPFCKRLGGKTQLLDELRKHVPKRFGLYFEPFLGGGALFFDLAATRDDFFAASISDVDTHLINAYRHVRDDVDTVVARLKVLEGMWRRRSNAERNAFYYRIRDRFNEKVDGEPVAQAARTIFLNKTCFNGIWRVNKSGGFNVPIGRSKSEINICDRENLLACSNALTNADISCCNFAAQFEAASKGDFLYADPPYWPVSGTADFTTYAADGFSSEDQARLRDCAAIAKQNGVHVLLSNADVPAVRKLYAKDFKMRRIEAKRSVNCRGKKRGVVGELLIW